MSGSTGDRSKDTKTVLFLDYYAEQFDAGAVNRTNYLECASYMEGLRDAMTSELSDEALHRFMRVESMLRSAANLIEVLRREQISRSEP